MKQKIIKVKEDEEFTLKDFFKDLLKMIPKIIIMETVFMNIIMPASFYVTKHFAKVNYKKENINFYYLGDLNDEEYSDYINICDQIIEDAKQNPFYKDRKVDMIFHANTSTYNYSALFRKSSAFTFNLRKKSYIQFCESNFTNNSVKSTYYKKKHQHILTEVAKHELTHAYLSYGDSFIDSIRIRLWRNEGLSEQFNKCNCHNTEQYVEALLNGEKIKSDKGGYSYFCYQLAVLYLHKIKNMDYNEIYKAKGLNYKKILREIRNYDKYEVLSWYKN